jgi:hypothetical protein
MFKLNFRVNDSDRDDHKNSEGLCKNEAAATYTATKSSLAHPGKPPSIPNGSPAGIRFPEEICL